MTVIELSRALAEGIKQTPELSRYFAAKRAYEGDADLQEKLFEYETQRKILGDHFNLPENEQDPSLISAIRDRVTALAGEIVGREEYRAYEDAKRAVNDLMAQVNAEISEGVFGVRPGTCTHDCSTCAGCSSRDEEGED